MEAYKVIFSKATEAMGFGTFLVSCLIIDFLFLN
jgi:hypothetical protein